MGGNLERFVKWWHDSFTVRLRQASKGITGSEITSRLQALKAKSSTIEMGSYRKRYLIQSYERGANVGLLQLQ